MSNPVLVNKTLVLVLELARSEYLTLPRGAAQNCTTSFPQIS